jgi:uncharacterized phage protein (TIGR01671 family)
MKREIKFKFWLSNIKKMTYEHSLIEISHAASFFTKDIIALQFTGLTDKNGKEIYEGDIVKCGYGVGEVVWKHGCFMIKWLYDKDAFMEFVFSRKGTHDRKDGEMLKVIGNIYENQVY